jgi:mRNA interferase MazF
MAKARQTGTAETKNWPKRGEIHLTALDPTLGHEIRKTRPALVIQNDTTNRYSATTVVAPITSTVRLPLSPLHVLLPADASTGLSVTSVAVLNQVRAVDRRRLIKKLGAVDRLVLSRVDKAIQATFALLPCDEDLAPPHTVTKAISRPAGGLKTGRYEE